MKLYELIQKTSRSRNILNDFSFHLFKGIEDVYSIEEPTADDFIRLCDREIEEIDMFDLGSTSDENRLSIYLKTDLDKDWEPYWNKRHIDS